MSDHSRFNNLHHMLGARVAMLRSVRIGVLQEAHMNSAGLILASSQPYFIRHHAAFESGELAKIVVESINDSGEEVCSCRLQEFTEASGHKGIDGNRLLEVALESCTLPTKAATLDEKCSKCGRKV